MKRDYRDIPVQEVINFAKNANLPRLLQAKRNIEEYMDICDYDAESMTPEILAPDTDLDTQRRLIKAKLIILEKRGAAHQFLTIIKEEMETRMEAYESKNRLAK